MINNLPTFILAAILLNISSGPDLAYIFSRTLAQGRLVGFVSSWGVCSGALIHILAAALGFSLILQSSPAAYALLKYMGAGYLLWLGIKAFRRKSFQIKVNGGALVVAVELACEAGLVVLTQHILGRSLQNSKDATYLSYVLGLVFLGLAVNFAFFV